MKYVGKQKALALAMMAMFASGSAHAVFDMSAAAPVTVEFAKELNFADDASPDITASSDAFDEKLDIQVPLSAAVAGKTETVVRLELSGATWGSALNTSANYVMVVKDAAGTVKALAGTGGLYVSSAADKKQYLMLTLTLDQTTAAGSTEFASTDYVELNFKSGVAVLGGTTDNTIGLSRAFFDSVFQAETTPTGIDQLTAKKAYVVKGTQSVFAPTKGADNTASAVSSSKLKIDVLDGSKTFDSDSAGSDLAKTVLLCDFAMAGNTTPILWDGTSVGVQDFSKVVTGTAGKNNLVLSGDFTFLADADGKYNTATAGKVFLSSSVDGGGVPTCATATTTATVDAEKATFDLGTAGVTAAAGHMCMTVNGTNPVSAGSYTLEYQPTTIKASDYTVTNSDLGTCGTLTKNGSSASVPMVLTPNSAWKWFMRVTNPSTQAGKVIITAYDDKGNAGPSRYEFNLDKGASTGLITVQAIVDGTGVAALTDAATVGVGAINKMRLRIEAEFGSGHNGSNESGVVVRTYVMPDANHGTFTQFQ